MLTAKIALIMKYLVRAVKYFFWFALILCITMLVLVLLGEVDPNPELMFRNGTRSLWQIAILFAVISAVYPLSGFAKREVVIPGEFPEFRDRLVQLMKGKEYELESEAGEDMTFRLRAPFRRLMKMHEDRITMTREPGGYVMEGLRKDVMRLASFLEFKFKENEDGYSKS